MKTAEVPQVDDLLAARGLKRTQLRRALLSTLMSVNAPLSQAELLSHLGSGSKPAADRVSVYRNLLQLKRVGLVHEVESNQYIACLHRCASHPHVVLFCQRCQKHRELKDHQRLAGLLEELMRFRFFSLTGSVMVRGVCHECTRARPTGENTDE